MGAADDSILFTHVREEKLPDQGRQCLPSPPCKDGCPLVFPVRLGRLRF